MTKLQELIDIANKEIDELPYGKQIRISDASASIRIDEASIDRIVVLNH